MIMKTCKIVQSYALSGGPTPIIGEDAAPDGAPADMHAQSVRQTVQTHTAPMQ
jgi:hypothetical protein